MQTKRQPAPVSAPFSECGLSKHSQCLAVDARTPGMGNPGWMINSYGRPTGMGPVSGFVKGMSGREKRGRGLHPCALSLIDTGGGSEK